MRNIVEVIYVYADAVKQSIIRVKLGKLSEPGISEIATAGFSGIIQQKLVLQLPGLVDLFHCLCITCVVMFIDYLLF